MRVLIVGTDSSRDGDTAPPPKPATVDEELLSFIHGRQNARVLIVDDDHAIHEILADILADEGYEIDRAYDGAEAVSKIIHGPQPDLLLLDMTMPRAPGQSVLGFIGPSQWGDPNDQHYIPQLIITASIFRDHGAVADERFVFVSGSPRSARREQSIPPVLRKPFDVPLLLATVRKAIDRRRNSLKPGPGAPPHDQ